MSHTEAMSCKLPLLDGEGTSESRLMMTALELESAETVQKFSKGNVASFDDMICAAWGLLLRCYTGQDTISFYFEQGNDDNLVSKSAVPRDRRSTFRVAFHEQDTLSMCVARAKDGYGDSERGGPSLVSTVSSSRSLPSQNTHVWVEDAMCKRMQDVAVQKVF